MVDPSVRKASQRAAEDRARALEAQDFQNRGNHPGSRYGTAPEDRPDLAPEVPPAVVADVKPEDVPSALGGALPENVGKDPADINRDSDPTVGKSGRSHRD